MANHWEDNDRRHRHQSANEDRRYGSRHYEDDERDMRRSYGGYSGTDGGGYRNESQFEQGHRDARYGRDDEERYGGHAGDPSRYGSRSDMARRGQHGDDRRPGSGYGGGRGERQQSGSDSAGFGRYGSEYGSQRGGDMAMGNDNQWERRAYGSHGPQYGEHRGKGPKGYTRSDDRIKEDVSDMLMDAGHLDASGIEVTVKDGEVTLSGTVTSRDDKRDAEDMVERCSGVKHVQNNVRVQASAMNATGHDASTQKQR